MALRYTRLQSTLKIHALGTVTLTTGPDDIVVIDLTSAPYAHGFCGVLLALQDMNLSGSAVLKCHANSAANGGGTDATLATMNIGASDTNVALEIPAELVSHESDRAGIDVKSLVFEITGTATDTVKAAVVSKVNLQQDGLTPSDVTTVS